LGLDAQLEEGKRGQFDVVVNGQTVVSRKGGLWAKLTSKPWPDVSGVVAAVRDA